MFKRYKLRAKREVPLEFKCRSVDRAAARRGGEGTERVVSMLKNPAAAVVLRGMREAVLLGKIESRADQRAVLGQTMKHILHRQREVRSACYKTLGALLPGAVSQEVAAEYVKAYVRVARACTDIEVHREGGALVDLLFKHLPQTAAEMKGEVLSWLRSDLEIVERGAKWAAWAKELSRGIARVEGHEEAREVLRIGHREKISVFQGFCLHRGRKYAH